MGDSVPENDTAQPVTPEKAGTNIFLALCLVLLSGGAIAFFTYKLVSSLRQKQRAKDEKKKQKLQKREKETQKKQKKK